MRKWQCDGIGGLRHLIEYTDPIAFIDKGDKIHLRWFTPEIEMDLCGHATLATAHCLKSILNYPEDKIIFETLSGGLTVFVA